MPQSLGTRNARLARVRELLTKSGRAEQRAFAFEGATLLDEALRSGVTPNEIFVTASAYESSDRVRALDRGGTPVYLVHERTFAKISAVETPSGILAVAPLRLHAANEILARGGVTLILADLNDPGNAGTLLRSAEAFGAAGVIFGDGGVDPHHPKVVRAAMGALFRLPLAVSSTTDVRSAAVTAHTMLVGLKGGAGPLEALDLGARIAVVVGHERHGLGAWEPICDRFTGIPMRGRAESLNAAVAGSIALYEEMRRLGGRG